MSEIISIKFLQNYQKWNGGEIAGFPRARADFICALKPPVAVYVSKPVAPKEQPALVEDEQKAETPQPMPRRRRGRPPLVRVKK